MPKLYPILIPYPISVQETYPMLIHGRGTFLGPGHKSAAIAYFNTWRVPRPPVLSAPPSTNFLISCCHFFSATSTSTLPPRLTYYTKTKDTRYFVWMTSFVFRRHSVTEKLRFLNEKQFLVPSPQCFLWKLDCSVLLGGRKNKKWFNNLGCSVSKPTTKYPSAQFRRKIFDYWRPKASNLVFSCQFIAFLIL